MRERLEPTFRASRWVGRFGSDVGGSRAPLSYLAVFAVVALVTLGVSLVPWLLPNASLLYLLVVLIAAVVAGRGPAITAAVASFLAFNFFLTEPRLTLEVADPADWIELVLFLGVAVIGGGLAADQRRRAEEAVEHERHARLLYEVTDAIARPDLDEALRSVADRLREEIGATGVAIEIGGRSIRSPATADPSVQSALRRQGGASEDVFGPSTEPTARQSWTRVSQPGGGRRTGSGYRLSRVPIVGPAGEVGAVIVASRPRERLSDGTGRVLASVAGQLWVALERWRLRRDATESEILRQSDEAKSALIDAVSHDLRTPLASIIAAAGSLRQREVSWSDEEREAFALAIEQEARRLDRIVGNLLDLGRIRAGAIRPDTAWYEPTVLVREAAGRLEPLAARRGQRIVVDLPDELPPIALDYSKVDQVLTNLLENALKFSPPGTEVRVTAAFVDGELRVSVEDAGPGLSDTERQRAFEPFYRGSEARVPGSGVGLTIAAGLVRAHGGRIWSEARNGNGTRFTFALPAGADGSDE